MYKVSIKKIAICLVLTIIYSTIIPGVPVSAHFPVTDGNITAVLHIDPDDDPIPGQEATLHFIFKDKTGNFNLLECRCIVTVTEQGKRVLSSLLLPNAHQSLFAADTPFTFPARDVYVIHIAGIPKASNEFKPFSLSWRFRVDQYSLRNGSTFDIQTFLFPIGIALGSTVIIFGVIFLIFALHDRLKKYKSDHPR